MLCLMETKWLVTVQFCLGCSKSAEKIQSVYSCIMWSYALLLLNSTYFKLLDTFVFVCASTTKPERYPRIDETAIYTSLSTSMLYKQVCFSKQFLLLSAQTIGRIIPKCIPLMSRMKSNKKVCCGFLVSYKSPLWL